MIWQEEQHNFRNQSSNLLIFIRQFWDLGKKWPGLSSAALSELFILFLFFLLFFCAATFNFYEIELSAKFIFYTNETDSILSFSKKRKDYFDFF